MCFVFFSYYNNAENLLNLARESLKEEDFENAYICLLKFLIRYMDQIKHHPEYDRRVGLPSDIKKFNAIVLQKTEELKVQLLNKYSTEFFVESVKNSSSDSEKLNDSLSDLHINQLDGTDLDTNDFFGICLENKRIDENLHMNSCFMNCIINCLFSIQQFVQLLPTLDNNFGSKFEDVFSGKENSLEWLRTILLNKHHAFSLGNQADPCEFLIGLLEHFQLQTVFKYIVDQILHKTCKNCKETLITKCPEYLINGILEIPLHEFEVNSLQELFDCLTETKLEKENCPSCGKVSYMNIKKSLLTSDIFIFKIDWHTDKNELIPLEIGLEITPSIKIDDKMFSIKGIVHFSGEDDNGHYEATLRVQDHWINRSDMEFNDHAIPPHRPCLVFCVAEDLPQISENQTDSHEHILCQFCQAKVQKKNLKTHQRTKKCLKAKAQRKANEMNDNDKDDSQKIVCQYCNAKVHQNGMAKHNMSKNCLKAQREKDPNLFKEPLTRNAKDIAKEKINDAVFMEKDANAEKTRQMQKRYRSNQTDEERNQAKELKKEHERIRKGSQFGAKKLAISKRQFDLHDKDFPEQIKDFKVPSLLDQKPCQYCGALKYPDKIEPLGFCCSNGSFSIKLPDIPEPLKTKLIYDINFRKNIRKYNNSLALCSWGVDSPEPKSWPNIKFQGRVYHSLGSIHPESGESRKWAQCYIHDGSITAEEEADSRMKLQIDSHDMNKNTLVELQNMLHLCNPYVKDFKTMGEIPEDQVLEVKFILKMHGKPPPTVHPKTFNLPTCQEVALIGLDERPAKGDIQIQLRGGGVKHISDCNENYDPLHYVLLFPRGEKGWSFHLTKRNGKSLTPVKFYRYLLMFRDESKYFNSILRSGRLFQEFCCTQFFKVERQRLKWVKFNQRQIHAKKYRGTYSSLFSQLFLKRVMNITFTCKQDVWMPSTLKMKMLFQVML